MHTKEETPSGDTEFEGEEISFQAKDIAGKDEVNNVNEEGLIVTVLTAGVAEAKHEPERVLGVEEGKEEEHAKHGPEEGKEEGHAKGGETHSFVLESEPSLSSGQASVKSGGGRTLGQADVAQETQGENVHTAQEAPSACTGLEISKDENVAVDTRENVIPEFSKDIEVDFFDSKASEDIGFGSTSIEVPVKDLQVESGSPEEHKHEKYEDDLKAPATAIIEVPVEVLEAEAGSPEEEKQDKVIETQEPSSNVTIADGGAGIVESSLHVEKSEENLEMETTEAPVEKTEAAHTAADGDKTYGVVVEKKNEGLHGGLETSTVLDAFLVAELSSELEMPGEKVEENKEEAIEVYDSSAASKDTEHSSGGGTTLEGEKLVDKEKDEGVENLETNVAETFTELKEIGVSSEQVEARVVTLLGGQVLPGDETSVKEQDVASVEAPKSSTIVDEPSAQAIKEEDESSKGEREAPSGTSKGLSLAQAFAEEVKDAEAVEEKTDHEPSIGVVKASEAAEDKKEMTTIEEELKGTGASGTAEQEHEASGEEKEGKEHSKDQDPVLSSDAGDATLAKKFSKRAPSSVFTKVKRTLVKAKKAILGKSPAPRSVSSEAQHEKS